MVQDEQILVAFNALLTNIRLGNLQLIEYWAERLAEAARAAPGEAKQPKQEEGAK